MINEFLYRRNNVKDKRSKMWNNNWEESNREYFIYVQMEQKHLVVELNDIRIAMFILLLENIESKSLFAISWKDI